MTHQQIAEAFSGGEFEKIFPYLSDDTEWNIVGENLLKGKENIIAFCEQTSKYFSEVSTEFILGNLVVGDNCVAIDGRAVFTKNDGHQNAISSCDVYRFADGKLAQVNSYCISIKKTN